MYPLEYFLITSCLSSNANIDPNTVRYKSRPKDFNRIQTSEMLHMVPFGALSLQLGGQFTLVRIDEPIIENEELLRQISDSMTIRDAFDSGLAIALPSAFVSYNLLFYHIPD